MISVRRLFVSDIQLVSDGGLMRDNPLAMVLGLGTTVMTDSAGRMRHGTAYVAIGT
jgi:hypothetical protein